ncbi:MAG TPA: hypothetical protein VGM54_15480 [Chthoniobacter sp.]
MRLLPLLSFVPICLALVALGDPIPESIPVAPKKARYESLRIKSPFSLATAPVAAPVPQASFAANWFVSGIGRIGGEDFVTVKSRDLSTEFSLYAHESDPKTGVILASVSWSDSVGKSTVILRKGNETARLEFNEAEVRAVRAQPAVAGVRPIPTAIPNGAAPLANGARGPGADKPVPVPIRRGAPIKPPQ